MSGPCSGTGSTTSSGPRASFASTRFGTAEELRAFFKHNYGPTIAAYRNLAEQPERATELDDALADLTRDHLTDGVMHWEYLVLTARRA